MKLRAVVLLLLSTFLFNKAHASHYAAVDISVQYAGTGPSDLKYKVILDIYFACEGNPPSTAEPIHYFSANEGGGTFNVPYDAGPVANRTQTANQVCVNDAGQEEIVHQLCDANLTTCASTTSPYPGYKHHRYETTITLTSQQTDWIFWWRSSARNASIKNISTNNATCTPQGSIFVEAGIDNLFRYDISTPKFMVQPLPYLCVNQPTSYLNGPLDPLGDSLEVLNAIPRQNYNSDYFYCAATGFSAANPIASTTANPYTVDPTTGTATFTPTQTGGFVLTFRCNKYDRGSAASACKGGTAKTGKLIAFIHRDVQVAVLPCTGLPPIPSELSNVENGIKLTADDEYTICTGSPFKFDIKATTTLPGRNLYIEANTGTIPGSAIASDGAGSTNVTGHFKWTPHYGNVGQHILIITTKDSTCDPAVLKAYKVIRLKVIPSIDAGPDEPICLEGGRPVDLFVKGAESCLKWSDIGGGPAIGMSNGNDTLQNPKIDSPYREATYIVTAFDVSSICKNKDTVSLYKDVSNGITIFPDNPIILCKPDYLQLEATHFGRVPVDPLTCGITKDTSDKIDSIFIQGSITAGSYDTLGPITPSFPNNVTGARQQYLIRKADILKSDLLYSTIKGIAFESKSSDPTYQYSNFKIYITCTDEEKISAIKGFLPTPELVYSAPGPVTISDGINKFIFDKHYNWDISQNLLVEITYSSNATANPPGLNPIIKFVPTDYISTISLTDAPGTLCTSTGITENYGRPAFLFYYREPSRPFRVTWTTPTFLSDSTILQPLAFIPKSTKHIVKTMGRNGCIVRDTADIYVPEHQYSVMPADTAVCYGETAPLRVQGGFAYKLYKLDDQGNYQLLYSPTSKEASCYDCPTPELKPEKTTTYKIAVYDSVWCIDTITARIVVLPLPDIRVINRDTVIKYGQSLQLLASGAKLYNWMPVGSLNNANISYPVATPTEPTTYVAGGIGSNGCRAFDTVRVDIDYRDNLFIPSGFSPNGDGKNDLFKVSNLTFQRIAEFRVFNRWGQEVFMANDNTGWDGNWKGEPQDMGTYTYQIRIGFPDGYVESYKGSVTLVR